MNFFSTSELIAKASAVLENKRNFSGSAYASDNVIMAKEAREYNAYKSYDVFLSHSFSDARVVYGLKSALQDSGLSAYVYWIDDAESRANVTPETAARLRGRMKSCKSLLYATSASAENSKWMPWELGYFDGLRGKVAVCPITHSSSYDGREYLGLYPIMEKDFWLWKDGRAYKKLHDWLKEA